MMVQQLASSAKMATIVVERGWERSFMSVFRLILKPQRDASDVGGIRRLRRLLKYALRSCQLRCTWCDRIELDHATTDVCRECGNPGTASVVEIGRAFHLCDSCYLNYLRGVCPVDKDGS